MRCGRCITIAVVAVLMVVNHASYGEDGTGVVASGAKLQKLGGLYHNTTGRSKTEGPVADHKGNVYFTDPYGAVIYRWNPKDGIGIFTDDSGGANGLFLDAAGTIVACQAYRRRVVAFGPDGAETVLADSYEGKRLNEPNDLYIDSRGGIYFSDPFWHVHKEPSEIDCEGVYYITPGTKEVIRVIDNLQKPNGIHGSPTGSVLYVIDTPQDKTFMYDVKPDGTLEHSREFAPHGLDGLTVDSDGNVYITALEKKVYVYTSGGELIYTIEAPEQPSNVCFGGDDNTTLFITAGKSLYSICLKVKGL